MHSFSKTALIMVFLGVWTVAVAGTGYASEKAGVNWFSYNEGIGKIKSEEKMGFLYFYTDWCSYCKMMDQQTFSDKSVSDYLNENFVAIRINADQEKTVANQYSANRFPSNWFLGADGQPIANRPGFITPDQMITMLKYLHSGSYKTLSFSEFLEKQE